MIHNPLWEENKLLDIDPEMMHMKDSLGTFIKSLKKKWYLFYTFFKRRQKKRRMELTINREIKSSKMGELTPTIPIITDQIVRAQIIEFWS